MNVRLTVPHFLKPRALRRERGLAVRNYKRSLELNPQNTNATAALKRIGQ